MVVVGAVGLQPPHLEAVLEGKYHQPGQGRDKAADDDEVDVVGGDEGVPVGGKVAEDGELGVVDEVDELEVEVELDPEDVGVEEEGDYGGVDEVGEEYAPEDEGVLAGGGAGAEDVLGDDRDEDGQDHVGDGRHHRGPYL